MAKRWPWIVLLFGAWHLCALDVCAQRARNGVQYEGNLPAPLNETRSDETGQGYGPAYQGQQPYPSESEPGGCPDCGGWHGLGQRCGGHGLHDWFRSSKNSPRATGKGEPLMGTSWLNRPISAGLFVGVLFGDQLSSSQNLDQGNDLFAGARLGWDFDHYWGTEIRAGFASLDVSDPSQPLTQRQSDTFLGDVNFLYYPWGDSRLRPYFLAGLGVAQFDVVDTANARQQNFLFGIPLGGGVKYQFQPNWALRAQLLDNIAFGDQGVDTMHNVSLTLGVEFRLGGKRRSYYPWHPSKKIW